MEDKAHLEGGDAGYTDIDRELVDWLAVANAAYDGSTDFLNTNYRGQWARNVSNFQSKHPPGSKYISDAYKTRSRFFRPKTRTAIRKNESAFASALFSASDVVVLSAENENDKRAVRDAMFWHYIINYRLNKTILWFPISVGAFQEAQIYGCVFSKQWWDEETRVSGQDPVTLSDGEEVFDKAGQPLMVDRVEKVKAEPRIRLVEIENFRFDPASDWTDVIGTSPYLIELMPMRVMDVAAKMDDPESEWKKLSKDQIYAYGQDDQSDDIIKRAREKGKDTESDHGVKDFEIVWVREIIMRRNGGDQIYYTLGSKFLLSDPVPIEKVYAHGRPYVQGITVIEAHRSIPSGVIELSQELQAETNDIVNTRMDNVKLALNKRKYVQRKSGIDLTALKRSISGGIIVGDDISSNGIHEEDTQDVTSSSYNEQTRLDADFDDLSGVFSNGSVQTNRTLSETVGGMQLMSEFANRESEYLIRTFVETWVEPVIRQLVTIEQLHEDNEMLVNLARQSVEKRTADDAQNPAKSTTEEDVVMDVPFEEPHPVDVRVSVGFGSLNPIQRVGKITQAIQAIGTLAPWTSSKLNVEAVANEVFGAFGYRGAGRFYADFAPPDGTNAEMQIEQKKLELQEMDLSIKAKHDEANLKLQEMDLSVKTKYDEAKLAIDREIAMAKLAIEEKITLEALYAKLGIEREKIKLSGKVAGLANLTRVAEIERREDELSFKEKTGRQGI